MEAVKLELAQPTSRSFAHDSLVNIDNVSLRMRTAQLYFAHDKLVNIDIDNVSQRMQTAQ